MNEPVSEMPDRRELNREELFPIREVARVTGINPVTLRAWERRYGLIQPTRTESGHRLYSQADIDEVRNILAWIERGVAVSKVGRILARDQLLREQIPAGQRAVEQDEWSEWQARIRQAVRGFDDRQLDQLYGQVFASYPLVVVFEGILLPLWRELSLNQASFGQTSEWLFLDTFLRARTLQRLQAMRHQGQEFNVILVGLPQQCVELELHVAGLLLGCVEVGIQLLAVGQPLEELGLICDKVAPAALVIYSNHPPAVHLPKYLDKLALALSCPLLLAGGLSDMLHDQLEGRRIVRLGGDGRLMQRRLQQYLAGHLDS